MSQLKKSKGNMYPWVSHMIAHIGGKCGHKCSYCYVERPGEQRNPLYDGPIRLIEGSIDVNLGKGRTIFIDHMNDLFAAEVPDALISQVLDHCCEYPENTYVFQTKNPVRYIEFWGVLPLGAILGTTIETNRADVLKGISTAPAPDERILAMTDLRVVWGARTFITVEPILAFDPDIFIRWLVSAHPEFVNIGADSKGHNLPEPTADDVRALIKGLQNAKIEIREKHNLERLIGPL